MKLTRLSFTLIGYLVSLNCCVIALGAVLAPALLLEDEKRANMVPNWRVFRRS
jgi:hypothetical protein